MVKTARPMADETGTLLFPAVQSKNNQGNQCYMERRGFRTNRGSSVLLLQHLNTCRRRHTANLNTSCNSESDENNDTGVQEPEKQHKDFYWNTVPGGVYLRDLEEAYNQTVCWRMNKFMVPTGAAGKKISR